MIYRRLPLLVCFVLCLGAVSRSAVAAVLVWDDMLDTVLEGYVEASGYDWSGENHYYDADYEIATYPPSDLPLSMRAYATAGGWASAGVDGYADGQVLQSITSTAATTHEEQEWNSARAEGRALMRREFRVIGGTGLVDFELPFHLTGDMETGNPHQGPIRGEWEAGIEGVTLRSGRHEAEARIDEDWILRGQLRYGQTYVFRSELEIYNSVDGFLNWGYGWYRLTLPEGEPPPPPVPEPQSLALLATGVAAILIAGRRKIRWRR